MTLWTLGELKNKIKNDLDLNDETMIGDEELLGYINAGVDEAEQYVMTIYEDYLLQSEDFALVDGVSEYNLPSNIYAHKIRKVFYDNGQDRYEIKRIRDLKDIPNVVADDEYRYIIKMNSVGEFKLKLFPASRETSSTNVSMWFLGNANTLATDADLMNIPEAAQFIIARAKLECARKEGHPFQMALEQETEKQRTLLVDSLTNMVPDEDTQIILDTSFYDDMGA